MDEELLEGTGALVAILAAAAITLFFVFVYTEPYLRALLPLFAWIFAFARARHNWTRRSLRFAALVALTGMVSILLIVGREGSLVEELELTEETLSELAQPAVALERQRNQSFERGLTQVGKREPHLLKNPGFRDAMLTISNALREAWKDRSGGGEPDPIDLIELEAHHVQGRPVEDQVKLALDETNKLLTTSPPNADSVRSAMAPICKSLSRNAYTRLRDDQVCTSALTSADQTTSLKVAVAQLRLNLASYKSDVLGRKQDAKAEEELEEALEAARIEAADSSGRLAFWPGIQAGMELAINTIPVVQHGEDPVMPDAVEWGIIAMAAFSLWRIVERTSSRTMPGPVMPRFNMVDLGKADLEGGDPKDPVEGNRVANAIGRYEVKETQERVFRMALLANVVEPGTMPGAAATSSITDLTEFTGPIGKHVGALIKAVRGLVAKPGGYTVTGDLIEPTGEDKDWQVLVRVVDTWTGDQISVDKVRGTTPAEASRAAGYLAAAVILSRSQRIPSWARWNKQTAQGLATETTRDSSVQTLTNAVRNAPSSGVLLAKLGGAHAFEGQQLEAGSCYARAVATHPRFVIVAYRLAITLGLLGRHLDQWFDAPVNHRTRVANEVKRACAALGVDYQNLLVAEGATIESVKENLKVRFITLAKSILDHLESSHSSLMLAGKTLRRSERDFWWPMLTSRSDFGKASKLRLVIRSARLTVDPAVKEEESRLLEALANCRRSPAVLSYNLACFHALKAKSDETEMAVACEWLEKALERFDSAELAGGWIGKDPDLETLKGYPRFDWILDQLGDKENE